MGVSIHVLFRNHNGFDDDQHIQQRREKGNGLIQKSFWWRQCSDRYIISLSPHLRTPFPNLHNLTLPPPPYSLCPSLPTETLKWLSSLPILIQKSFWWWQCSDRYIISLAPHLYIPFPPSLISLVVSVDVKHRVYFVLSAGPLLITGRKQL